MAKKAEELIDDVKRKDIAIVTLNKELMRTQEGVMVTLNEVKTGVIGKATEQLNVQREDVTIVKLREKVIRMEEEATPALEKLYDRRMSIEQLNDEVKWKEVNIVKLSRELTRTKKREEKALVGIKKAETLRYLESASIQTIMRDLIGKKNSLDAEVAILNANLIEERSYKQTCRTQV